MVFTYVCIYIYIPMLYDIASLLGLAEEADDGAADASQKHVLFRCFMLLLFCLVVFKYCRICICICCCCCCCCCCRCCNCYVLEACSMFVCIMYYMFVLFYVYGSCVLVWHCLSYVQTSLTCFCLASGLNILLFDE